MRGTSFAGDAPVAETLTATAFALAIAAVSSFIAKSAWTATQPGAGMKWILLGYFCSALCCPLMYTAFMWGVGADGSERACGQAAIVGIWAYVGTKWGNQCFLAERLHIVYTWRTPRFKSRVFFGLVGVWLFTLGCGIYITETCTAKLHGPHQQCYMGFDLGGTLLILVATFAIDSALTAGFVLPLFRAGFAHARTLAVRSVIAAAVSLFGVLGSFLYIPLIGNEVRVWVMWLAVLGDVTLNACVIFAITNFGAPKDREVNPNVSSDPCSSNRSNHHSKPAVQHGDLRADPVEVELPPDLEDGRKGGDSGGLGSLSYSLQDLT